MTSEQLEQAAAKEYAKLPDCQHWRLMRIALTGEIGGGQFSTVRVLLREGYLEEAIGAGNAKRIVMTRKGRSYCKYHAVC